MKSKFLFFSIFLFSSFVFSQNIEVSGRVIQENNKSPLAGVNINIVGTSKGIQTDLDGTFKISNLKAGDVLSFSYIGLKPNKFTVSKSESITIKLEEDAKSLEELVIVGYGSKKKKDVTGSVTVISAKTIEELTEQVKSFKRLFYVGGGDTDEYEDDFDEAVNELVQAVEKQTIEILTS
jgi:hypothetical protein